MPFSRQKLVDTHLFDADTYFSRGAHMPVMLFIGERNRTRRSPEARARRAEKAVVRGFHRERIEKIKAGREQWNQEQWTDGK